MLTLVGNASNSASAAKLVLPIGILAGLKTTLIAADATIKSPVRAYDFDEIERILETNASFNPGRLPSIEEYAGQMYGVSRTGELEEIALEFTGAAAASALRYRFHPSQVVDEEYDGDKCKKRTIRFQAIGLHELGLDILRFGLDVRVLSPISLAKFHVSLMKRLLMLSGKTNIVAV